MAPATSQDLPLDPVRDFTGIALFDSNPMLLVVGKDAAIATVQELVATAKANPGKLNVASPGIGSASHVAAEGFCRAVDIRAAHIPHRGGGPEIAKDLMKGTVHFFMAPYSFASPFVRDGRLRALATASAARNPELPDVPTLAEAGVAGYEPIGAGADCGFAPARRGQSSKPSQRLRAR